MSKSILYIGNHLYSSKNNPSASFSLIKGLKSSGYNILFASHFENKVLRLLHMIWSFFRNYNKYDLIIIDVYSTQNFWYAIVLANLAKTFSKPYINILHGGDLVNRFTNSRQLSLFLFKNSKVNISPSKYLKDELNAMGLDNVKFIPNPVFLENYSFNNRKRFQPKLLWVRAFDEIYNPHLAINVLEKLLQEFPNAELCMVGPSKDESVDSCRQYVNSKDLPVLFNGKMKKKNWVALANRYDIFLNTSNIDNMPVSVLEAMALGLPVVSTNVGGIPYLIDNKINGIIVPPNDTFQMTEAVKQLLLDPENAKNIAENARALVATYDWKIIQERWAEVIG